MGPKTWIRVLLVALLLAGLPTGATASQHVRTIVEFDPGAGELPEGIAVVAP